MSTTLQSRPGLARRSALLLSILAASALGLAGCQTGGNPAPVAGTAPAPAAPPAAAVAPAPAPPPAAAAPAAPPPAPAAGSGAWRACRSALPRGRKVATVNCSSPK